MTVQVPDQQYKKRFQRFRPILISTATVSLVLIAVVWIMNQGNSLSNVFGIVFTLLGILITFLQWQPHAETSPVATGRDDTCPFYEQIEGLALGVTKTQGAIVVSTNKGLRGATINLSFGFQHNPPKTDFASSVIAYKCKKRTVYLAVFSSVNPGNYTLYTDAYTCLTKVSVWTNRVVEVDWR